MIFLDVKTEQDSVIFENMKRCKSFHNTNDMCKDVYVRLMHGYQQKFDDNTKYDRARY